MTTTYELYTNENGTPKAVEGKAPAIIERVENIETSIENIETSIENIETSVENIETSVETAQATADACLPLSGGTMTGVIQVPTYGYNTEHNTRAICGDGVGEVRIGASSPDKTVYGASLNLFPETLQNANGNEGGFLLQAEKNNVVATLQGLPNGVLTWYGQTVARFTNVSGAQNGYMRFNNGITLQWGFYGGMASNEWIAFPLTFDATIAVYTQIKGGTSEPRTIGVGVGLNGFEFVCVRQADNGAAQVAQVFYWLAIGYIAD